MNDVQILINDQQMSESLSDLLLRRYLSRQHIPWTNTDAYVAQVMLEFRTTGHRNLDFVLLHSHIQTDINAYQVLVKTRYKKIFRPLVNALEPHIASMGLDRCLKFLVMSSNRSAMVTTVAKQLADRYRAITVRESAESGSDIVIRNTIHNEKILQQRIAQNRPYWYIDAGYTNHLAGRKLWHRIVRNNLHQIPDLSRTWPADRLKFLESFPRPWHHGGNRILIVESSSQHYQLYGDTLGAWRDRIIRELDFQGLKMKRIFYPKENKKTRKSVHQYLSKDPDSWYCVISDSSAAAIEAIWLGIPVITFRSHITSPVARNNIGQIKDLYRGSIGEWLCALTYSQFTKKELQNGQAMSIMREYHGA